MNGFDTEEGGIGMANLPDRRRERYLTPVDWASYTMNRMLEDFFPGAGSGFDWVPAVDVIETRDSLEVRLELPGLCKDEIDIQFSNGVLTIKGEKKEVKEEDKVEKRYHHREMRYGSFVRAIALPVDVKPEEASAQCSEGVLSIVLPKEDRAIHKKIEIKG